MSFLSKKNDRLTPPATPDTALNLWSPSNFDGFLASSAAAQPPSPDASFLRSDPAFVHPPRRGSSPDLTPRICGARCGSTWVKPWKSRTRPVFEEDWGCSSRCLQKIIAQAIRREIGDGFDDGEAAPHRHRVPLGLVMLAQGWITHSQLQSALQAQRRDGHGRIGDLLVQSCGLDQQRVTRALGMQWNCPVFTTTGFFPSAMALIMPKRFLVEFGLVPLRVAGNRILYLASEGRMDASAALAVEQMSGLKVETGLLDDSRFSEIRSSVLAAESINMTLDQVRDAESLANHIARRLEQTMPVASRLVRVHQYFWLRTWLESGSFSGTGTLPAGLEDVHDYLYTIGP
jgi:hypothetical protein